MPEPTNYKDQRDDAAAFWAVRLTSPDCSLEDRRKFEQWKAADPLNAQACQEMMRASAIVDQAYSDPAIQEIVSESRESIKGFPWRRYAPAVASVAAMLCVVVGLGVWSSPQGGIARTDGVQSAQIYETVTGERSTITLSDGSTVTLNTNSMLEVDFSSSERDVKLLRGQGFFEVAKDVDRSFNVHVGGKRVTALGTAFDVSLTDNKGVEVVLVEGVVEIGDVHLAGHAESHVKTAPLTLRAGERLVAHDNASAKIEKANVQNLTSWREGRLVFQDEPIADVLNEMNRYSVQKLKLDDSLQLTELRVSGVFDTGRASTFVSALEAMHPIKADRSGQNELTLVWQD